MSEKSDWEQGYDQAQMRFYEERKVLTDRIAELEQDLSNKETEYTDLWDDALALQSRIAELEYQLEDWTNNGWAEDYKARIAELEAERLELRKTLGWAYDLDEYKDNPEVQKMYNKFNQNHRSKNERQILQER